MAECPHIVTDDEGTSHCSLAAADDAELAELRALKAKVDGCEREDDLAVRLPDRWAWRTAGAFLAWLREPTDVN